MSGGELPVKTVECFMFIFLNFFICYSKCYFLLLKEVAANQGNKAGNRPGPATSGQAPAATSTISSNSIPAGPLPSNQHQRRKENSTSSDVVGGGGSRDRSKSPQ